MRVSGAIDDFSVLTGDGEAFIKRNTPVPGRTLSALYDRPSSDS
jgi:hypothetical protein